MPTQTEICIVRHGQSTANADYTTYGSMEESKIPLSSQGRKEGVGAAQKVREHMLWHGIDPEMAKIYSSPYVRALDTARMIRELALHRTTNANKTIRTDHLLIEQCFGESQSFPSFQEFLGTNPEEKRLFETMGPAMYRCRRGDSITDVYTRVGLFVERRRWFAGDMPFCIIVAHNVACQCLQAYLTDPRDLPDYTTVWPTGGVRFFTVYPELQKAEPSSAPGNKPTQ